MRALSRSSTARRRGESGAAAVEMALVTPFLVVLVFGIIAFGIVFAQQLALGNAARQAARYGVVADRSCVEIKSEAQDAANTIAMAGTATEVVVKVGNTELAAAAACADDTAVPCDDSELGDNVYVQVNYTSELIIPLAVVEPTFDLSGKGVFRCEFS